MIITAQEAFYLIDAHWWYNYRPPVKKWLLIQNQEAINMLPEDCYTFGFFDGDGVWTVLVGIPIPGSRPPLPAGGIHQ